MRSTIVLNFFPAFTPPSSGGEMRIGMFYNALSQFTDVTILTSTDFGARFEQILHTPSLRELRFPKDDLWRDAYATLERSGLEGDLSGLAFALAVSDPSCELRRQAHELASKANVVIHEFPFSEPIFAYGCPCPEIYNSHNFEVALLPSIVRGPGLENALLKLIRLESNLVNRVQRVFAVSTDDAERFRLFYGIDRAKLGICPNGIDQRELMSIAIARKERVRDDTKRSKLFFIGSAHYPNVEAANFLASIAEDLSDCQIVLAGSVCNALSGRTSPNNLTLLGQVDPSVKNRLLGEVDLFVNPVVLGSGTSLKALEALGSAVPMVSTSEGVRGLQVQAGIHCEVVTRDGFAAAVRRIIKDDKRRESMAAAGFAFVSNEYSWDRIAATFYKQINSPVPEVTPARSLVLALNDYPALQPGSGGIARIRGLLGNLDCDVALVSFGTTFDVALIGPDVLHTTIPKTAAHLAFEDAVNRDQPMSVNDGVASLFAGSNQALTELVCAFASRAGAVVFEHPYMAPMLDSILRVRPELPVIYSAHNVEATHKSALLRGHRIAATLVTFIGDLERLLVSHARLIVCCTEADAAYFATTKNIKTIVVPNGCTLPEEAVLGGSRHRAPREFRARLGFLGSSHGPNVEAAAFIVQKLAPTMPDAVFELVGGVCTALEMSVPANVILHGLVDETTKTSIMAGWDVALNPVQSGGGSSLKLPDYMAHALASLSTPAGARGFLVEAHAAGRIAKRNQFHDALATMLGDPEELAKTRANARSYAVEELAWKAVTASYRRELAALLTPPAIGGFKGRNLLVVTYRYTEPSLGGAEEYLIEILKRLRSDFRRLDLAAIDIEQLTNHNHFGCRMTALERGATRRLGQLFDRAQYFTPDEISSVESLVRARTLERAWTDEERILLSPFVGDLGAYGRLRLFGGFFWPENHNGVTRRWTAPRFSFLAPQQARSFHISGYAATDKLFRMILYSIRANGDTEVLARYQQFIPAYFDLTVSLPRARSELPLLLSCEVDEHEAPGDHRPFGVLLDTASVVLDTVDAFADTCTDIFGLQVSAADLTEQYDEELRVECFDRWIHALHDTAMHRDSGMEADFAALRGPHSRALQNWLAEYAHDYDVVLVQGIPFDVIPSTVETLSRVNHRPRVVTLPHL